MILRSKGSDIHLRIPIYERRTDDSVAFMTGGETNLQAADLSDATVIVAVTNGFKQIPCDYAAYGSEVLVDVWGRDASPGLYKITVTIIRGGHRDTLCLEPLKVVSGQIATSISHLEDVFDGVVLLDSSGMTAEALKQMQDGVREAQSCRDECERYARLFPDADDIIAELGLLATEPEVQGLFNE